MMITMRNLGGIDSDVASQVACAEFAGASIPAFAIRSLQPRRVNVSGLLQFADGQAAKFTRMDDHFFVTLHKPMDIDVSNRFLETWGYASRVDEMAMGRDPEWSGPLSFKLKSATAVEAFVRVITEQYGKPLYDACSGPTDPQDSVKSIMPEVTEFLPAPRSKRELGRLEIRALLAHSRACQSEETTLELMEQALWKSIVNFGDHSRKTLGIRASLVKAYKLNIAKLESQQRLGVRYYTEFSDSVAELIERRQSLLVNNLRELGRHNAARSEEAKLPAIWKAVEKELIRQLAGCVNELRRLETEGGSWSSSFVHSLAFATINLAKTYEKMGRRHEAVALLTDGWVPAHALAAWPKIKVMMQVASSIASTSDTEERLLGLRRRQRDSRQSRSRPAAHAICPLTNL
jgi:hypothetical protein